MKCKNNVRSLIKIYFKYKNHKLSQWREFCSWIKELPHGDLITSE